MILPENSNIDYEKFDILGFLRQVGSYIKDNVEDPDIVIRPEIITIFCDPTVARAYKIIRGPVLLYNMKFTYSEWRALLVAASAEEEVERIALAYIAYKNPVLGDVAHCYSIPTYVEGIA